MLLAVFLMAGCSFFGKKKADPLETFSVEQLFERGKAQSDKGDYDGAAKTFARLVGRFPFGPYTEQAQLDQAYAQYKMNKPDDSYSTVNRFIKTYPSHKHIDYAYYLRALINFDREEGLLERYAGLDMTQRDQSFLRQSFDDFAALIKRHPDSRYAPDAKQRMIHLRDGMAQAELNVALFYLRQGAYVAASNRAKSILETYDQSRQVGDALAVMVRSYHALGQDKLADDSERVLKLNFPEHPSLSGTWPDWRSTWWKLLPLSNRGTKPLATTKHER
ncbi:MAG TPA: outer membrane protein assembly factor BamD [Dokdonella sp.]|uniref:outer membrane protein assembly factor BamD n=1 Tax=Dokdonella sp. TaxID=2291710 RepID=UPI002C18AFE5|nr:outer membrane protein assembly factor BamD [Dokdonella sp.]HOX70302.1 outer membrane protein assembly factor BamD [Dokdonella sp.]HPG93939.1 outer membrane protein assembly factor BamD [Dokdonella sp.]